jgi:hypothetical protein
MSIRLAVDITGDLRLIRGWSTHFSVLLLSFLLIAQHLFSHSLPLYAVSQTGKRT